MKKIESLIDDPRTCNDFFSTAKRYQDIAGGKLSAYIMWFAGQTAKLVGATEWGNARVALAEKKFSQIHLVEELTSMSEMRSRPFH